MGTKNVQANKKCAREQISQNQVHKVPIAKYCLEIMELNCRVCIVWSYLGMVLLLFMTMYGLIQLSMALFGLLSSCMALNGLFMALL